jgi:hypothetical protein
VSTRSASLASETPDTSVVVTPADSILKGRAGRSKRMADLSSLAVPSALSSRSTSVSSKRKRGFKVELNDSEDSASIIDTSRDEELAMKMQEDEYAIPDEPTFSFVESSKAVSRTLSVASSSRPGRKSAGKPIILDSDEEDDDELSEFQVRLLESDLHFHATDVYSPIFPLKLFPKKTLKLKFHFLLLDPPSVLESQHRLESGQLRVGAKHLWVSAVAAAIQILLHVSMIQFVFVKLVANHRSTFRPRGRRYPAR